MGWGTRAAGQWGGSPGRSRCAAGGRLRPRGARGRSRFESGPWRLAGAQVSHADTGSLLSARLARAATPTEGREPGRPLWPRRTCTRPTAGSAACGASAANGGSGSGLPAPGSVGPDGGGLSRGEGAFPWQQGARFACERPRVPGDGASREGQCPPRQVTGGGEQEVLHLVNDLPRSGVGRGKRRLGSGEGSSAPGGGKAGFPFGGAGLDYPHPRNVWPVGRAGHRRAGRQP